MPKKSLDQFTFQYSVNKTLRFALTDPQGDMEKFLANMREGELKRILVEDKQRAEDYKQVKKIIDAYHREFIEEVLGQKGVLTEEDMNEYVTIYEEFKGLSRDSKNREKVIKKKRDIEKRLREAIVKKFKKNAKYKKLFNAKLITELLPQWLEERRNQKEIYDEAKYSEEKHLVEKFNRFATYFTDFHQNRANMYVEKDQNTAIPYRIVNVNLPKFLDNYLNYEKLIQNHSGIDFSSIEKDLKGELRDLKLSEFMKPSNFLACLNQSGIDSYNTIVGGKTLEAGKKIQGINEILNQYRMKLDKSEAKKIPLMTSLYKQILSDRESHSFLPEQFTSDQEMLKAIREFYESISETKEGEKKSLLNNIKEFLDSFPSENTDRIYIKATEITRISHTLFAGDWALIHRALEYSKLDSQLKKEHIISIEEIETALQKYKEDIDEEDEAIKKKLGNPHPVIDFFKSAEKVEKVEETKNESNSNPTPYKKFNIFATINQHYQAAKEILKLEELHKDRLSPQKEGDKGGKGFQQVTKIKNLLDAIKDLLDLISPLYLEYKRQKIDVSDKDDRFYVELDILYDELFSIVPLYNKVRNHVTKKNRNEERFKINFDKTTLLDGWDVNKETANLGVILRKDNNYYLAIVHKKHSSVFNYVKKRGDSNNKLRELYTIFLKRNNFTKTENN